MFVEINDMIINLDNITVIDLPSKDCEKYIVNFTRQLHSRYLTESEMSQLREKMKELNILHKIEPIIDYTHVTKKEDGPKECRDCNWYCLKSNGFFDCTGAHVCSRKLK